MDTQKRIKAFVELGKILNNRKKYQNTSTKSTIVKALEKLEDCILEEQHFNPWFIPVYIEESIKGIIKMLDPTSLNAWLNKYPLQEKKHSHRIGVIMAGNIPMVGFHDFLCVLLAGDIFIGKLFPTTSIYYRLWPMYYAKSKENLKTIFTLQRTSFLPSTKSLLPEVIIPLGILIIIFQNILALSANIATALLC